MSALNHPPHICRIKRRLCVRTSQLWDVNQEIYCCKNSNLFRVHRKRRKVSLVLRLPCLPALWMWVDNYMNRTLILIACQPQAEKWFISKGWNRSEKWKFIKAKAILKRDSKGIRSGLFTDCWRIWNLLYFMLYVDPYFYVIVNKSF